MGREAADVDLLRERFELAVAAARRGARGIALMAVRVHEPNAMGARIESPGDTLADSVLARVRSGLRRVDTVAELEPLHYAVLLERPEPGAFAVHAADGLLNAVRGPFADGEGDRKLRASIGISMFPSDGDDVKDLMRHAEEALEAAELSGGDAFGFYSGPMSERAGRRVAIERALVTALEKNELELHFQPQIDTRDGTLAGIEALLRWQNDQLGRVAPPEFVPLLEENGGIDAVGAWVLERACENAAGWAERGRPVRIGVNVSARQLRTRSFEKSVLTALDRSRLDPSLLELELTEGVLVENEAFVREMLDSLRRAGVRVAVDDFGTGYASLAYIRQFPMDTLKIDRQFVRGLPLNVENAAITSAIVALGRSLRLEIVAEGVETEAEEEFLHSLDCFVVQGFRHAHPMSRGDLAEWWRARPWA